MSISEAAPGSKGAWWAGRSLSAVVVLFMIFDGVIKLPPLDIATQAMTELGWPADPNITRLIGAIGLISTALYALPRTSMLGAILLTAYMGGAISTHVRIGNPLFSHTLFGVYLGVILWGGLYLRDARVQALIPFSRKEGTKRRLPHHS
ncbi:DoxX family protein [Mesorhizobium atlanticum]